MDIDTLRNKFYRYSELYPELYHATVIWHQRGDDWAERFDDWSLVEDDEFTSIDNESMTNDARAKSFYLWRGEVDQQRVESAISMFRTLADAAAQCVETREFHGRIPPGVLITVSEGTFNEDAGLSRVTRHESRKSVCDWLGHVFAVVSIDAEVAEWSEGEGQERKVLRSCEVLRLPVNTFEASAAALDCLPDIPHWNTDTGELIFRSAIVRKYARQATNCRQVLDAFESQDWPTRIDDPIGKGDDYIHSTAKSLNDNLHQIVFRPAGGGFLWELSN